MFKNWTNRDWLWLLGALISIIILLIASIFAKDKNIELNFSIVSSAVSIALALVAIFIALSQSRDNKELSTSLKVTMSIMNEKLNSVDEKVNKIDPDVLVKVYRQKIDDVITEVGKSINSSSEISPEELEEKYRKEFTLAELELEDILHEMNRNNKAASPKMSYRIGDKVMHKKWGVGKITAVNGQNENTEIDVVFAEPVGLKRLLAKFAPITKLD
ncbi:hypothetical protein [Sporosarcina luteola]|uniref:hypothetical protein n=1 Tax=Sporosarcina luteola TaxID=582850 RepID=UPI00203B8DCB|nr:hypothetical protein [Sporosarcina luteola]MCM3712016.1 hypothetical protein [Sporosarcina luteola]